MELAPFDQGSIVEAGFPGRHGQVGQGDLGAEPTAAGLTGTEVTEAQGRGSTGVALGPQQQGGTGPVAQHCRPAGHVPFGGHHLVPPCRPVPPDVEQTLALPPARLTHPEHGVGLASLVNGKATLVHHDEGAAVGRDDDDVGLGAGDGGGRRRAVGTKPRPSAVTRLHVGDVSVGGRLGAGAPEEDHVDHVPLDVDGHPLEVRALAARPSVDERGHPLPGATGPVEPVDDDVACACPTVSVEEQQAAVGRADEVGVGHRGLLRADHRRASPPVDRAGLLRADGAQAVAVHVAHDVHVAQGVYRDGVDVVGVFLGGRGEGVAREGAEVGDAPVAAREVTPAHERGTSRPDPHGELLVTVGPEVVVGERRSVPAHALVEGLGDERDRRTDARHRGEGGDVGTAPVVDHQGRHPGQQRGHDDEPDDACDP